MATITFLSKNEVDNSFHELFGLPAYSDYVNGCHYTNTKEAMGIAPLAKSMPQQYNIPLGEHNLPHPVLHQSLQIDMLLSVNA
jgi:hypothetical protein